jgi:hypothetical protein
MMLVAFVVEQFENRVIDFENNAVVLPICFRTMEARKVQKENGGKVPSAILSCLTCYCDVKKLYNGVDPDNIMDNQRKVINTAWSNTTD